MVIEVRIVANLGWDVLLGGQNEADIWGAANVLSLDVGSVVWVCMYVNIY